MLTTKSTSITFSTPVSPPIDSTSHIWCTRSAVSSVAAAKRKKRLKRTAGSPGSRRRLARS